MGRFLLRRKAKNHFRWKSVQKRPLLGNADLIKRHHSLQILKLTLWFGNMNIFCELEDPNYKTNTNGW
jgi:hypothetical protein